jgi:hypothetical protein
VTSTRITFFDVLALMRPHHVASVIVNVDHRVM